MPTAEDSEMEIPELTAEWFRTAAQPLRRGTKRAVFVDETVANRFQSDEQLEGALRALLEAAEHVRKAG